MFSLTKEQLDKIQDWKNQNNPDKYAGAIGGRYTYCFSPTSLGVAVTVKDSISGKELDVTEYENW